MDYTEVASYLWQYIEVDLLWLWLNKWVRLEIGVYVSKKSLNMNGTSVTEGQY
jgi:hypothetical protein